MTVVAFVVGCTDDTAPTDDSTPDDTVPDVIDGQMPKSSWGGDKDWQMLVHADGSACMVEPVGFWGAHFDGPLTVSDGTFSWAGTHTESHGPKKKDNGAPVTATGTVTPTLLTMHFEVVGNPQHTRDLNLGRDQETDTGCEHNG